MDPVVRWSLKFVHEPSNIRSSTTSSFAYASKIHMDVFRDRGEESEVAKLLGSWKLVQWQIHGTNGSISYPLGEDAVGQLMYGADGRMSAQLMRSGQSHFASSDWRLSGDREKAKAWSSYFGYFGTFSIDKVAQVVHHHIEGSWFPNLVGTTEIRRYEFKGSQLVLNADTAWGKVHIVWEKHRTRSVGEDQEHVA